MLYLAVEDYRQHDCGLVVVSVMVGVEYLLGKV